jgi:DNA-binding GntR family transcriptional regulator
MLEKIVFRKSIKDILVKYMLNGNIKPNERLSLPQIASELEISVTPIREALTQLTEIGIVTYIANRGFFVTDLKESEAIELYQIISLLEGEALKNCTYKTQQLKELSEINELFKNASNNSDRIEFDTLFHQKLIENYDNKSAKKIIEDIRIKVSIYELKFMGLELSNVSYTMHKKIIEHLSNSNNNEAAKELNANWKISIEHLKN